MIFMNLHGCQFLFLDFTQSCLLVIYYLSCQILLSYENNIKTFSNKNGFSHFYHQLYEYLYMFFTYIYWLYILEKNLYYFYKQFHYFCDIQAIVMSSIFRTNIFLRSITFMVIFSEIADSMLINLYVQAICNFILFIWNINCNNVSHYVCT